MPAPLDESRCGRTPHAHLSSPPGFQGQKDSNHSCDVVSTESFRGTPRAARKARRTHDLALRVWGTLKEPLRISSRNTGMSCERREAPVSWRMRAVLIQRQGSPVAGNIAFVTDFPDPLPPGPGQVLIKTLASAFNHMDLWVGRGVPGLQLTYPRISGCDACGIVESVGTGVDPAWMNRRVIINAATRVPPRSHPEDPPASTLAPAYELIGEHTSGMFCEKFLAPAANLADIGDTDANEGAAYGLCALTAYSMMFTKGQLRPGQTVLITGIGGGVATSALALARHHACRVAVTSRHQ